MPTAPTRNIARVVTAGSVDDGKSTLLGHLLVHTGGVTEDQLRTVERLSRAAGLKHTDYSLLLDGLSSEREQGITIDVAHRYMETPRRRFIFYDSPGHGQYTRNMVTAASQGDIGILLVDAEKGILPQTRRHSFVLSLMGVRNVIVAVNKMDLVDFSENHFHAIVDDYFTVARKLTIPNLTFIPVSAVGGDNIGVRSAAMAWYQGSTLMDYLENFHVSQGNPTDFRFPVQWVNRPDRSFRGYSGSIVSGRVSVGQEVTVLPSGARSRIRSIVTADGELKEAAARTAVTLVLEDELDVSRGDMIVRSNNLPRVNDAFECMLFSFDEEPLTLGREYLLKINQRKVYAELEKISYVVDVETYQRKSKDAVGFNDIARVSLRTRTPVVFDPYVTNGATGNFILVDPDTKRTRAGGTILSIHSRLSRPDQKTMADDRPSPNLVYQPWSVTRERRESANGHKAAVLWFTGLPGAGKTTLGQALGERLFNEGRQVTVLDGDQLRGGLNRDLGFGRTQRTENLRRAAEVARLMFESGQITICCFVSPLEESRRFARSLIPPDRFLEVHVHASPETCARRDPKGHYRKAAEGKLEQFTGVSAEFEPPVRADLVLDTEKFWKEELVNQLWQELVKRGVIPGN